MRKVTVVTDPSSGLQALYVNERLALDLEDQMNYHGTFFQRWIGLGDVLECALDLLYCNAEVEEVSGYMLIRDGDDGYWPNELGDVPEVIDEEGHVRPYRDNRTASGAAAGA